MQKILQDRNKKLLVDYSTNRLTLLDGRFYFTDDKEPIPIPSVTTILNAYPKDAGFYEWLKNNGKDADDIMHEAGRRGSRIHDLTERYDKGEKIDLMDESGELNMAMNEWAMFERYVDFTNRFNPNHEIIEQNFISKKLNAAGTVDRVTILGATGRWLIDIKTSPSIYEHYWLQQAAYERMLYELQGIKTDHIGILHLNAKVRTENPKEIQGIGWKLYEMPKDRKYYFDLFQATQKLWYAQNGNLIPKVLSYGLSHQVPKPVPSPVKKKADGKKSK